VHLWSGSPRAVELSKIVLDSLGLFLSLAQLGGHLLHLLVSRRVEILLRLLNRLRIERTRLRYVRARHASLHRRAILTLHLVLNLVSVPRLHPVQLMGLLEVLRLLLQLLLWEQLLLHLSLLRLLQLTHRRLDLHLVRGGGPCLTGYHIRLFFM